MNIKEIQQLIKFVSKSGVSEVKIELKDLKISVKTGSTPKVVHSEPLLVNPHPIPQASLDQDEESQNLSDYEITNKEDNLIIIKSPIIGTFYRKPSPDKPNFVELGGSISEGDILCVVEAMKLFNEIESEYSGKIVKILVENASPVEFDQPLFIVDPS
ncbi:MAG: acetyl-CoA carboxylase biotin carboxyl carrier protein [Flavobacteriaceae bacterium]|nr:acetyl-CoA carboxylase biotin carboxyl carrier protein [Flavobacteriaceae bacterium]